MYTTHQYHKLKRENDALKHHYNQLVDVLNNSYNEKKTYEKSSCCGARCGTSNCCGYAKEKSSNVVEMLKKQNALLNRALIDKNKQLMSLKQTKYTYLTSPRSPSSLQVDQFSEISELSS